MLGFDSHAVPRKAASGLLALILACGGDVDEPASTRNDGPEGVDGTAVAAGVGEEFELPHGRRAVVAPTRLQIAFRDLVEESRCPADVECVTAGNAAARFSVHGPRGGSATITLNTDRRPREAGVLGFRVRLIELSPRPGTASAPVDTGGYVATLTVTEERDAP